MNKKTFVLVGILVLILFVGGVVWYGKNVRIKSDKLIPLQTEEPKISDEGKQDENGEQPLKEIIPLPLSWERQKEVMEKSRAHVYSEGHMIPKGISDSPGVASLENQQAHEMEIARLNSLADGIRYPWHGNLGYYDGKNSYPERLSLDPEIPKSVQPDHHFLFTDIDLSSDGKSLVKGLRYFQLNFDTKSVCITLRNKARDRKELFCDDWFSKNKVWTIGSGHHIQIYGLRGDKGIVVSKMIIIEDSSPANWDFYFNNFQ